MDAIYPTIEQARVLRDVGVARAALNAEAAAPGWSDVAALFLNRYCRAHEFFISENVSEASRVWGMVQPPTDRAWGGVYKVAVNRGWIKQDGAGRSARRHASICPRWKSLIYNGGLL